MKHSDAYRAFLATLKKEIICPYCGKLNQLDPPIECCGEVHAEEVYDNGDEIFTSNCLEKEFSKWLSAKESYTSTGGKYE